VLFLIELHYLIVTHLSETAHGNDREEHTKEDSFIPNSFVDISEYFEKKKKYVIIKTSYYNLHKKSAGGENG